MTTTSWQGIHAGNLESYSDHLKSVVNLLTMNEVPKVVGNVDYLVHKYPGDVDMIEKVYLHLDGDDASVDQLDTLAVRENALNIYTDQFQNIVKQLYIARDQVNVIDITAGLDYRYNYYVDENSTDTELLDIASTLTDNDLITVNEYHKLLEYRECREEDGWREFAEHIRLLSTVRWTPRDVVIGEKELRHGKVITLQEALGMEAPVKIKVVTWTNGRFQTIETLYMLHGEGYPLTNYDSYYDSLIGTIKYLLTPQHFNPLKLAKQLWYLAMVTDVSNDSGVSDALSQIVSFGSSDAAALNQITSDIEVLKILLDKHPEVPKNLLYLEVLSFKQRGLNHLSSEVYQKLADITKDVFFDYLHWNQTKDFRKRNFLTVIVLIDHLLQPIIARNGNSLAQIISDTIDSGDSNEWIPE